jgi:hypothetical protein
LHLAITDTAGIVRHTKVRIGDGEMRVVAPVVLDLDGDGVELVAAARSTVAFDFAGDGGKSRTGWVGADDALLVLDRNQNGIIDSGLEISFTSDLAGAKSDLEGLRAYDTNGDGRFDANDAQFSRFQLWRDANQDGVSQQDELATLAERGIASIDLSITRTGAPVEGAEDNVLYGTSTYARTDGAIGAVGDVFLAYREIEVEVVEASGPFGTTFAPNNAGLAQILTNQTPASATGDLRWRHTSDSRLADGQLRRRKSLSDLLEEAARREAFERRQREFLDVPEARRRFYPDDANSAPPIISRRRPGRDPTRRSPIARQIENFLDRRTRPPAVPDLEVGAPVGAAVGSALRRGLGVADRRVLAMVDAMAAFEPGSAADLGQRVARDPRVAALLTSLPDVRQ